MKFSLLLLVALATASLLVDAAAAPDGGEGGLIRQRRSLFLNWGWDISDFFHRAWRYTTHWVHNLVGWYHRHPHVGKEDVYHIGLPGGHKGVVRVVTFISGHKSHQEELVWDGHHLSWKSDGVAKDNHYLEQRLRIEHQGVPVSVSLQVLAKHLKQVPAGSRITVELLGTTWKDLRIVLHVHHKGGHGKEDAKKSVSVLVMHLVKEMKKLDEQLSKKHHHKEHDKDGDDKKHPKHHDKDGDDKKHHKHHDKDGDDKKHHKHHDKDGDDKKHHKHHDKDADDKKHHKHHDKDADDKKHHKHHDKDGDKHKHGGKKASSSLVWNGHGLSWDDANSNKAGGKKGHRQLRVSQDGVSHVIPLNVLAKHVGNVPAGSKIGLEIVGKTLSELKIVLYVHVKRPGKPDKTKTVTVPVVELIKEADVAAQKSGQPSNGGKVVAQKEVKTKPESSIQKIAPKAQKSAAKPAATQV